jgi:hypothetical protein
LCVSKKFVLNNILSFLQSLEKAMSHVCNAHLPNQILESTKPTYRAIMQSITHPVNNQLHDCTAARLEGVLRDAQLLAKAGAGVVRSNGRVGAGTVGSGKVRGRPATADLASLPLAGWPLVDPSAVSLTIGSSAAQRIPPPEQGRTSSATATDNNDGSAPSTSDRGHPDPDQVTRPPTGDSGLRADADIDSLALACGPPPVSRCCVLLAWIPCGRCSFALSLLVLLSRSRSPPVRCPLASLRFK